MQGALFCNPENIITAPFWDNPLITRNNKAIKYSTFPSLFNKISSIADFYRPGTCTLKTKEELTNVYYTDISPESLLEIHFIIKKCEAKI